MEREKFLDRIRHNLPQALLPEANPEHPGSFAGYSFQTDVPLSKHIADFKEELESLSGHVHLPGDASQIPELILEILRSHQAERIIAWDKVYLGLSGLLVTLTQAGIVIEESDVPRTGAERQACLDKLSGVPVGLTGAHGGLADTGAIALINGPGRGRLASLLPPVHIALLPSQKLYPSLPAFLAANPAATNGGSNLVLIAGPSRTADIEMTLSMGVHGPKEMHVIIF